MQAHISAYQAMKSCCGKTKSNRQAFSAVTYSYYCLLNTSKNITEPKPVTCKNTKPRMTDNTHNSEIENPEK